MARDEEPFGAGRDVYDGKPLLPGERIVLERTREGELADLAPGGASTDPSEGADWGDEQTIRGEFLTALCTGGVGDVGGQGIAIRHAKITGTFDLAFQSVSAPLAVERSYFSRPPSLGQAHLAFLSLDGSHLPGLAADLLRCDGDLRLGADLAATGSLSLFGATIGGRVRVQGKVFAEGSPAISADGIEVRHDVFISRGSEIRGEVQMRGAHVGGQVNCSGATILNQDGTALNGDHIHVEGGVFLDKGFVAEGVIRFVGATVGGVSCSGGKMSSPGREALACDRAIIRGGVFLGEGFHAEGHVRFHGARISSALQCAGTLDNQMGRALTADGATMEALFLKRVVANGEVSLINATVNGPMYCSGATITSKSGAALSADRVTVQGAVHLSPGFEATGSVRFSYAKVEGQLALRDSNLSTPGGVAFDATQARVGSLLLDGLEVEGEVDLSSATIEGQVSCVGGTFRNEEGAALTLNGSSVRGDVWLTGGSTRGPFTAEGTVALVGAKLEAGLSTRGATLGGSPKALDAERMHVDGFFEWFPVKPPSGEVDLSDARVGELRDDISKWPAESTRMEIDGFSYGTLPSSDEFDRRLEWVRRYASKRAWAPQPFEHLAATYRAAGHEGEARRVMIAKEEARTATMKGLRRIGYRVFGLVVGYGHRLWGALVALVVLSLIGGIAFWIAHRGCDGGYDASTCRMTPTVASERLPGFQAVVYALDTVLPVIDMRQQDFWTPERGYLWIFWTLIIMGWVLTTMIVAGLTRAVTRQ